MAEIQDVIGSYTPLTWNGKVWRGACPIEASAEPLEVEGDKFRCYGCGAAGNALEFLRAVGEPDPEGALANGHDWTPTLTQPAPPPPKYGFHRIEGDARTVLIVAHRRAAKVAEPLLPSYLVCAWPDGGDRWGMLAPLQGKNVLLFPSPDGMDDMLRLEAVITGPLGCTGKILTEGMDLAAFTDSQDELVTWARAHVRALNPAPQVVAQAEAGAQASDNVAAEVSPPLPSPPPAALAPSESPTASAEPPPAFDPDDAAAQQQRPPRKRRLRVAGGTDVDAPDPDDAPLPVEMGEDQIALRFAVQHGEDWRYVKKWGQWFQYDGDGWRRDETDLIDRLAVEFCRQAVHWPEARALTQDGRRKIAQRRTAGQIRDLARNDRRIAATVEQWDSDPYLVGVPGGVFCIESGKVIEGDRAHYVTKRCAVAPATGTPKRWLEHLHRMMQGDDGMINFLHLYAGYCATGDVSEQAFAFLYGLGQTGKGTFLLTVGELLGDYAVFSEASTFLKRQSDKHLSELARFMNARLVIIDEVPSGSVWNEERIKRCTGGGKLTVNFMHSDPFDMQIKFKLAVAGNSKPQLRRVGKEMQRRIRLVKCMASIPDDEVDTHFREHMIAEEGPQILNWILEGAMRWKAEGLPLPEAVSDATRDYMEGEDSIGDWLAENTTSEGDTRRPDAYANYKAWFMKQGNDHAWSPQTWWSAMEDRGYTIKRTASDRLIKGLGLKPGSNL